MAARRQSKGHKIMGRIVIFIVCVLIYILVGAIAPFLSLKAVEDSYQEEYTQQSYTGEGISVDEAGIVEGSEDALDIRLLMIANAKEKIRLATFSMKPDEACMKVCAALYEAAERGVQVEILVDGLSGEWDMKRNPMYYALGSHKNVTMKYYNLFRLYKPWTFNARLHDKFLITDDKELILGGRNTSNYFLGSADAKVLSYDREVYVHNTSGTREGSVIAEVQDYFDSIWSSKVSKVAYAKVAFHKKGKVKKARQDYEFLSEQLKEQEAELYQMRAYELIPVMKVHQIRLITNPTHIFSKSPNVWYTLKELMLEANEQILIQSPYLVFSQDMYDSFAQIAQTGVKCEALINSIEAGDNICASSDYLLNKKKLLQTGFQIYEFHGAHSMHNKSLVIDDRLAIIGSYNFDMRSTYINTESMLVIDGEEFSKALKNNINAMKDESVLVKVDGTYEIGENLKLRELSKKKKRIFSVLPYVLKPIRFLL